MVFPRQLSDASSAAAATGAPGGRGPVAAEAPDPQPVQHNKLPLSR